MCKGLHIVGQEPTRKHLLNSARVVFGMQPELTKKANLPHRFDANRYASS